MIYEIRNYHYEPSLMKEYREWATKLALPYIRKQMDLVGFWINVDEAPQIGGKPLDELGSATVTWIIRWDDMAKRNDTMSKAFASGVLQEIMKEIPGQEIFLRTEAKFAESL